MRNKKEAMKSYHNCKKVTQLQISKKKQRKKLKEEDSYMYCGTLSSHLKGAYESLFTSSPCRTLGI